MNTNRYLVWIMGIGVLFILPNCKDDTVSPGGRSYHVIYSSSFESASDVNSWNPPNCLNLYNDTPPHVGGEASANAGPWVIGQPFPYKLFPPMEGDTTIRLQFYARTLQPGGWGRVSFLHYFGLDSIRGVSVTFEDTSWKFYSVEGSVHRGRELHLGISYSEPAWNILVDDLRVYEVREQ